MEKLISALFITLIAVYASAATIYVDANGTGDYPTIQAAIDDANDGDIILLFDGVYTGNGNRGIDFFGKAITLKSLNGPNNCIIDCNGTESEPHRGFYFHNGEDANSILDGLTITNGLVRFGGGILCESSSPKIKNCILIKNSAFINDYSSAGGAIAASDCESIIINCKFIENTASVIFYTHGLSLGGAMVNDGLCPEVKNCTFSGNSADYGGAVCNTYIYKKLIISDCAFMKNSAIGGGAIFYKSGSVVINNCTFSENSADEYGGAIYFFYGATLRLLNSVLWGDTAPDGNEIAFSSDSTLDVNFCNIKGGSSQVAKNSTCIINWGTGNIDFDPCFVNPDDNDFHLSSDSPCINAGDPNYIPEPNETDLDGNPRVLYGRIDMGAYEFKWPDLKVKMWLWPRTFNCTPRPKHITVMMYLPRDIEPNDVNDGPLTMRPCDVQSKYQRVYKIGRGRRARTVVIAAFDKTEICACLGLGWHRVNVAGRLQSGRHFYGFNILKIKRPRPRPWPFPRF